MTDRKRKGMWVKNTNTRVVEIQMETRLLRLGPAEEQIITAEEVRDPRLREYLQVREISIVRPSTEEEEQALLLQLDEGKTQAPEESGQAAAAETTEDLNARNERAE